MLYRVDWAKLRATFRDERETRVGSRADLLDKTGENDDEEINASTVYRLETDPDYFPRLNTIVRLVEAMGLTLSDFFARIEGKEQRDHVPRTPADMATSFVDSVERLIVARATPPIAAPGTTVLTIPRELDEGEQELVIQTAVDVADARASARTESPQPRRQATTHKRQRPA